MDNESAGFGVLDVWFIENLEIVPTLKQEIKEHKWMAKCMDEKSQFNSGISSKKMSSVFALYVILYCEFWSIWFINITCKCV